MWSHEVVSGNFNDLALCDYRKEINHAIRTCLDAGLGGEMIDPTGITTMPLCQITLGSPTPRASQPSWLFPEDADPSGGNPIDVRKLDVVDTDDEARHSSSGSWTDSESDDEGPSTNCFYVGVQTDPADVQTGTFQ